MLNVDFGDRECWLTRSERYLEEMLGCVDV